MDRDRKEQEKYDNATPPQNIVCKKCNVRMTIESKDLLNSYEEKSQVLFMFRCPKCKKGKAFYEDGTEWIYDSPKCPNCNSVLSRKHTDSKEIMTTLYSCKKCSYKKEDIYDFKKSREEREKREEKERKLLATYRERFCMNEKDGQEYIEFMEALEVAAVVKQEEMDKYDNPAYQKALHLKKTTIPDLEKLLTDILEKTTYTKLFFEKPELSQYVLIKFSVQDSDSSRNGRISSSELEKIIEDKLESTNWRLVSNSIIYRLGYLEGQLKGYEQEEDLIKLAGTIKETKPKQTVDEAKRRKYEHGNVVQLAKLEGEFEAIDNIRKRRLEKEPDGFYLDDSEGGNYNCGICHASIPGSATWWTPEGLRCTDCQRNYKAGIIPPEIYDKDYGYDVVVHDWQMQSNYGVHSATVRKLLRQGVLKGRELKRLDGITYHTLFLVSENKEFFKEHPKQSNHFKTTLLDKKGRKIEF